MKTFLIETTCGGVPAKVIGRAAVDSVGELSQRFAISDWQHAGESNHMLVAVLDVGGETYLVSFRELPEIHDCTQLKKAVSRLCVRDVGTGKRSKRGRVRM